MSRDVKSDDELLAAYVDGVTELSIEERRRVEAVLANDPAMRRDEAATRSLLGRLRELPRTGAPDWTALEAAIGAEVGPEAPRAPWWRVRWRWMIPGIALATGLAIAALVVSSRTAAPVEPAPLARAPLPTPTPESAPVETMPLWLDGAEIEVALDDVEVLDGLDELDELDELELELGGGGTRIADDDPTDLMPGSELDWVDTLDDGALELAERWLERPATPKPNPGHRRKRS